MGFRIPWLESVSHKERQKREDKARRMMFPFGEEQKAAELRLLRSLIETREQDSVLLFQLFQAKASLSPADEDTDSEELLAEWLGSRLARGFTARGRAVFWALAELELPMQSLDEMPGPETVNRRAEQLLQQHPDLLT